MTYFLGLGFGILCISFAAVLIRFIDLPALIIAAYRLTIASLILLPLSLIYRRREWSSLQAADVGWAVVAGSFLALHFTTWIASLAKTSVANSVVLVSMHPLLVVILAHRLLKEPITAWGITGIGLALAGCGLITYTDWRQGPDVLRGDLLALVGAMAMAAYLVIGRRLRPRLSLLNYISVVYGMAAGLLLVAMLLGDQPFSGYSRQTYVLLLALALGPQLLGHSSLNWALRYLSAAFVSVSILAEPIGSAWWAYLFLNEVPGWGTWVGGGLICVGIYLVSKTALAKNGD